ncbi:MAG: hypothetical protein KIT58_09225 [Planctomycetota bacterium]|nr:hypothetical protein [Planctomycetota bacterium]
MPRPAVLAAAALLGLAGCESAPEPAPPVRETLWRTFPDGLTPLTPGPVVEVGGHRLAVFEAEPAQAGGRLTYTVAIPGGVVGGASPDSTFGARDRAFHELRDASTGQVLLPLGYHAMTAIPGHGVFVLPADERLRRRDDASQVPWRLKGLRERPCSPELLPRWRWFDPQARRLVDTDIVMIERYLEPPGDRAADAPSSRSRRETRGWLIVHRKPDEVHEGATVGRLDASLLAPDGALLGYYERFAPACGLDLGSYRFQLLDGRGRFTVLSTHTPDGRVQDHLLGEGFELLAAPEYRIVALGDYLARPAPGTSPEEGLWELLQRDGHFAALPGAVGLRPVHPDGPGPVAGVDLRAGASMQNVAWWLVRHARPGEPGHVAGTPAPAHAWGYASVDFRHLSGPVWDAAEVLPPPDLKKRPQETPGVRRLYHFPALLVQEGGRWLARPLSVVAVVERGTTVFHHLWPADPSSELLRVTGATAREATQRLLDAYAENHARGRGPRPARRAREAEARRRRDFERRWADAVHAAERARHARPALRAGRRRAPRDLRDRPAQALAETLSAEAASHIRGPREGGPRARARLAERRRTEIAAEVAEAKNMSESGWRRRPGPRSATRARAATRAPGRARRASTGCPRRLGSAAALRPRDEAQPADLRHALGTFDALTLRGRGEVTRSGHGRERPQRGEAWPGSLRQPRQASPGLTVDHTARQGPREERSNKSEARPGAEAEARGSARGRYRSPDPRWAAGASGEARGCGRPRAVGSAWAAAPQPRDGAAEAGHTAARPLARHPAAAAVDHTGAPRPREERSKRGEAAEAEAEGERARPISIAGSSVGRRSESGRPAVDGRERWVRNGPRRRSRGTETRRRAAT